ncbi:MAG: hypothetical protein ACI9UT_000108 [Flavobacteriales bacterium]|jgi:hypothetical protein
MCRILPIFRADNKTHFILKIIGIAWRRMNAANKRAVSRMKVHTTYLFMQYVAMQGNHETASLLADLNSV